MNEPSNSNERSPYYSLLLLGLFGTCQLLAACSLFVIANSLAPGDFGQFSVALSFQFYVAMLGGLGLRSLFVRDIARDQTKVPAYLRLHWQITPWSGLAASVVGYAVWLGLGPKSESGSTIYVTLAIGNWFSILSLVPFLEGLRKQHLSILFGLIAETCCLIALLCIKTDLPTACLIFASKWIMVSVASQLTIRRSINASGVPRRFDVEIPRRLLTEAATLTATNLCLSLPLSGVLIMAQTHLRDAPLDAVGLGVQFATAFTQLSTVGFRQVQTVILSPQSFRKKSTLKEFCGIILLLLLAWLSMSITVNAVIVFILPVEYQSQMAIINSFLLAGLVAGLNYILMACLIGCSGSKYVLYSYLAGCVALTAMYSAARTAITDFPLLVALISCISLLCTFGIMLATLWRLCGRLGTQQ